MIMDKEIEILQEQLRVKDAQIERLQTIIENLTNDVKEDGNDGAPEPQPYVPTFWERHPRFSYSVFVLIVISALAVLFSPLWWESLWIRIEGGVGPVFTFSAIGLVALVLLCWLYLTPAGRRLSK